jgi:hypothetical protein
VTVGWLHPEPVHEPPPLVDPFDDVEKLEPAPDLQQKSLRVFSCLAAENVRSAITDDPLFEAFRRLSLYAVHLVCLA